LESDCHANAPAKLRRACSASQSATGLPRAASFSRLLAVMLTGPRLPARARKVSLGNRPSSACTAIARGHQPDFIENRPAHRHLRLYSPVARHRHHEGLWAEATRYIFESDTPGSIGRNSLGTLRASDLRNARKRTLDWLAANASDMSSHINRCVTTQSKADPD